MANTDNIPKRPDGELKNLKFVNSEIYSTNCDIKGEPVANLDSDSFGLTIVFPKRVTVDEAKKHAQRIAKAVNLLSSIERYMKDNKIK